jgi:hypothetical protein
VSDFISRLGAQGDALELVTCSEHPTASMVVRASGRLLADLVDAALTAASRSQGTTSENYSTGASPRPVGGAVGVPTPDDQASLIVARLRRFLSSASGLALLSRSRAGEVSADVLGVVQVRSLLCAGEISDEDAVVALGLRPPTRSGGRRACRASVAAKWNDLVRGHLICSLSWEHDGEDAGRVGGPASTPTRAVVVVHEAPPREVHSFPWNQGRAHARISAARWAQRNGLVLLVTEPIGEEG